MPIPDLGTPRLPTTWTGPVAAAPWGGSSARHGGRRARQARAIDFNRSAEGRTASRSAVSEGTEEVARSVIAMTAAARDVTQRTRSSAAKGKAPREG